MPPRIRITAALARVSGVVLALALLAAIPTEWVAAGPSVCPFRNLFGVECLGCGMTRAISCLLHGDGGAALRYNPLVAILFPLLGAVLFRDLLSLAARRTGGSAP